MKVPEGKTIVFTIVSHPTKDKSLRWAASVTFPAGAGPDAILPVTVEDGAGNPVSAAVLEFAGQDIAIRYGAGELRYSDFIKGKHEPAIWLKRRSVEPVPGSLTFA